MDNTLGKAYHKSANESPVVRALRDTCQKLGMDSELVVKTLGTVYPKLAADWSQSGITGSSPVQAPGLATPLDRPNTGVGSWMSLAGPLLQMFGIDMDPASMQGLQMAAYSTGMLPRELTELHRLGSGTGTVAEANRQRQAYTAAMQSALTAGSTRIAAGLNYASQKAPSWLQAPLQAMAQGAIDNPSLVSGILMFAKSTPEGAQFINQFMGDVPTSYVPLARSVYMRRGGSWDDNDFKKTVDDFNGAYQAGKFRDLEGRPINNDDAQSGVVVESELHPQNFSMDNAAKLSQAANAFMSYGMAPTVGAAMNLVKQFGADKAISDQPEFFKNVHNLATQLDAAGVDRGTVSAASEISHKLGLPFNQAISAVRDPAVLKRFMMQQPGMTEDRANRYAQALDTTITRGQGAADSYKAVAAFVNTQRGHAMLDKFNKSGNPDDASALFTAARMDPYSRMNKDNFDGNSVSAMIPSDKLHTFAVGDLLSTEGGAYGAKAISEFARNPALLKARMRPDGSINTDGLDPASVRLLGNQAIQATIFGSAAEQWNRTHAVQNPSAAATITPPPPQPLPAAPQPTPQAPPTQPPPPLPAQAVQIKPVPSAPVAQAVPAKPTSVPPPPSNTPPEQQKPLPGFAMSQPPAVARQMFQN